MEPIGIYRMPSPPAAEPTLRSVQLAPIGVIPLAAEVQSLSNKIYRRAIGFLTGL